MSTFSSVFTAFQSGQGAALAVVVGFALLSFIAVDFVWLRVLVVGVNQLLGHSSLQAIKRERAIFHSQLGAYMASLLFANLLSSISFIINASWVAQGGIATGQLCTSQAILGEIADIAAAFFTGAIAVHTFNSLVLKFRLSLWFCFGFVLFGWALAIILAIFPINSQTKLGPFYTLDGLTCGISPEYPLFETLIHLVPIFVASLVAAVFYSLVFLILRGTIAIRGGLKLNLDYESRRSTMYDSHEYPRFIAAIARSMLWYPVVYVVLMFPHLVTCLLNASGFKVSEIFRVVTAAASALLGLANVLIFYNTIRIMGPAFDGTGSQQRSSEKSIGEKSFIGRDNSPVDVAPPVSALTVPPKARAFPPPRHLANQPSMDSFGSAHSRQASSTFSGDSSRALIPPAHLRNARSDSSMNAHMIDRPITPASELNEMMAAHAREPSYPTLNLDANSLPAPRRTGRSPVVRRPTLGAPTSPMHPSAMIPVPLKTPMTAESSYASTQRNSFINMYASSRDDERSMPTFTFGSPSYSSSGEESDGAFGRGGSGSDDELEVEERVVVSPLLSAPAPVPVANARRPKPKSLRSEVRHRLSTVDSPEESAALSSIAWASLVAHAASSNVPRQSRDVKSIRRRSNSVDSLAVPSMLRPGMPSAPSSARLPSARMMDPRTPLPETPQSAATPRHRRWDSKSTLHEGPARLPTYGTFRGEN
ncbi:hypothetical protein BDW22DRAFT_1425695 [Trametopsis cervina]|nr:hypothetical protein BDW22DRAFT_1425695 [Trametopsis cervina]